MYIRPMLLEDAVRVCHNLLPEQEVEYRECGEFVDADSDAVNVFNSTKLSFTAHGVAWPKAIWGFNRITNSTVAVWLRSHRMTDLRDWVLISRLIYETGSHLFETTTDIYRIQCLVAADRDGAVNFAKRFGLRVEGTLHDYAGAGRDYYALAITRATWKEELNGRWNRR